MMNNPFDTVYGVKIKGFWDIKNYRGNELINHIQGQNVITETGLDYLASFLASSVGAAAVFDMVVIGIGTDATAEAASNTALGTELARATGTASYGTSYIYKVTATFPSGTGTGAIVEYGLFSSGTGGSMFSRDTEAVINKGANDTLVVTTEVTFT